MVKLLSKGEGSPAGRNDARRGVGQLPAPPGRAAGWSGMGGRTVICVPAEDHRPGRHRPITRERPGR